MKKDETDLLRKFIEGRCTDEELLRIRAYLATEEGSEALDEIIRKREQTFWNHPDEKDRSAQELVKSRRIEMERRIEIYEKNRREKKDKVRRFLSEIRTFIPLKYAAVGIFVVLAAALGLWQLQKNGIFGQPAVNYVRIFNPRGIPAPYTLSDGTVVYLAAGSSLQYPASYPLSGRNVKLEGEAFFKVKHDAAHPFTICSDKMETCVLGTSFKVSAYRGEDEEVSVATGRVRVCSLRGGKRTELAQLTPGLKIQYNPHTGGFLKGKTDVSTLEQWKGGELLIEGEPMRQVAHRLQQRYGVRILFADTAAAGSKVEGSFSASESLPNILGMLGFVGKFRSESSPDGKTYTLLSNK